MQPTLRVEQAEPSLAAALPPGTVIPIAATPFQIGRGFSNQLWLPHHEISRRHARILFADDYYFIEDLESRNGTLVNGARLAAGAPHRLQDGHLIQFGAVLLLHFTDPDLTHPRDDIQPLALPGMWLDSTHQAAVLRSVRIPLTAQQYALLALLYRHAGQVVTREEIADALWSADSELTEQMIDNTISRLRARLQHCDPDHVYIVTVRGRGYLFQQRT